MKSIYYFLIMTLGFVFINGCETDTNGPIPDTFEEGGLAYLLPDATSSGLIDMGDPSAFNFKGVIDVLWEPNFEKLTMKVAYNGNYTDQYTLIDDIVSTPHSYSIKVADLVNVIPQLNSVQDIKIGDYFTFFVNSTIGGKEYPVYKTIGGKGIRTVASGLIQALNGVVGAAAKTDIIIRVPCAFVPALVTGDYIANSTDWGVNNGEITITADPANKFIVYVTGLASMEGLNETGGPVKMIIDPNSYNITVVKTVLSPNLAPWGLPAYTNYYYSGTGSLNTCNGTYTMSFLIGVDQGNWGNNGFILTKKP